MASANQLSHQKAVIIAAILILVFTVAIAYGLVLCLVELDKYKVYQQVQWDNKGKVFLKSSPTWFWYDDENNKLIAIKKIDSELKTILLDLMDHDNPGYPEYQAAIDKLAFLTTNSPKPHIWLILLTAGLSAVVGVQIRTIFNFIGKVCYKKDLDIKAWWPWYTMRPFLGFLLGALLIILIGAQLLKIDINYNGTDMYWFGIAVLAGFGVEDLFLRIRLLSKTLFGVDTK